MANKMVGAITVELVRSSVSMRDIVNKYGFKVGNNGRIPCPFHHGRNNNLGFDDRIYHCFVCGAKGDTIDFVMKLFKLTFLEAVERLCEDFNIQTVNSPTLTRSERMRLVEAQRRALEEQKQRGLLRKVLEEELMGLQDYLWQLEDNMWRYAPKRGDVELHPLYKNALDNIEGARMTLKIKEEEVNNYDRECYGA